MSAITNVWRQLVQRRLLPVAILLIAALAAVPLALAAEPEAPAPAPAIPTTESAETALTTEPIVALATVADRAKRRKVLGTRKNPFGLPKSVEAGSATAPSSDGAVVAKTPSAGSKSSGGSSPASSGSPSSGSGDAPVTSDPAPEPAPKTYAMHELTVRFGDEGASERRSLKRLQPLPSAAEPVLIYLGVLADGKTAVFLVDHGVSAVGDGECRPSPDECETIRLRAGETEFFDVEDETGAVSAQYQLDLVKIHKSRTTSATAAKASSRAGQRVLKARVSDEGPTAYRWDDATGTLEKRSGRELRGSVVRTAVALP